MRYVSAMYDAPVPARAAINVLIEEGFPPLDLSVLPFVPGIELPSTFLPSLAFAEATDRYNLRPVEAKLAALGIAREAAGFYAEGLRRGAILVIARTPTLSAAVAAAILETTCPLSVEKASREWAEQPELRYRWSQVEAMALLD
jgi:hypothetical protein